MAMASLNSNHLQMQGDKEKPPFISIGEVMAGECTENSIAATSSIQNWWHDLHACSLSSWSTSNSPWQTEPKNNSESSGEENLSISTSFTNASNHSDLSAESVRSLGESGTGNEFVGETVGSDNHLWNHLLLSVGCRGELHNQDVEQNLPDAKNISAGMFDPTCDYSKKLDDSWGFSSLASFNGVKNQLNVLGESSIESQRDLKSSDMVVNWPLPDAAISNDSHLQPRNLALHSVIKDPCDVRNFGSISCFGHDIKLAEEHGGIDASWTMFGRSSESNGIEYPRAFSNSDLGDRRRCSYGFPNAPCTNSRSFTDLIATPSYLNRPLLDINLAKPFLKTLDLSGCRKQALQTSPFPSPKSICNTPTKRSGRTQGSQGRKRSSEDNSESVSKKPKEETSAVSSTKVPKVKLGDKITALQQIVSPFGKTDTASVLWEAIGYIRFLQEQIQLLSTPYMKGNASKDLWGGLERKDRGDGKLDLKSRGLCLVPISCTPQVYPENCASDYSTPVYRGCLYR